MKRIICLFCIAALCLCSCGSNQITKTRILLDTVCSLTVPAGAEELLGQTFDLCGELEKRLSRTVSGSEIDRINRAEGAVEVSMDTAELIRRGLQFGALSGGRFDITICPVSELWNFSSDSLPDSREIAAALPLVDYRRVSVQKNAVDSGGTRLDLGAIAKGYIADRAAQNLREFGLKEVVVNFGGCVVVVGDRGGEGYVVGVQTPFADSISARVLVSDCAVVTAGTYQRYLIDNGKNYHHILDPETGYAVETDLDSATVITKDAADADALSTICILLGSSAARELIEALDDTEAIFVDRSGKVTATDGCRLQKGIYRIE